MQGPFTWSDDTWLQSNMPEEGSRSSNNKEVEEVAVWVEASIFYFTPDSMHPIWSWICKAEAQEGLREMVEDQEYASGTNGNGQRRSEHGRSLGCSDCPLFQEAACGPLAVRGTGGQGISVSWRNNRARPSGTQEQKRG